MNPTLKGHKLLVAVHYDPDEELIARLNKNHPDLEIAWHNPYTADGGDGVTAKPLPEGIFKDATALFTWIFIPTPEQAPKLKLVQLTSAGANQCFEYEIYKNKEVDFCTSNGTHP